MAERVTVKIRVDACFPASCTLYPPRYPPAVRRYILQTPRLANQSRDIVQSRRLRSYGRRHWHRAMSDSNSEHAVNLQGAVFAHPKGRCWRQ